VLCRYGSPIRLQETQISVKWGYVGKMWGTDTPGSWHNGHEKIDKQAGKEDT
ncbi:11406_t:CDS:2, partial [Acaulospora morrowiae]